MDLYIERGYRETLIEDITNAADVSRRTFFHYFKGKEDVLSSWFEHLGNDLRETFVARPHNEPVWDSLRASFEVLFLTHNVNQKRAREIRRLLKTEPKLVARHHDFYLLTFDALRPSVEARLGHLPDALFASCSVVRAALAAQDAAIEAWTAGSTGDAPYPFLLKAFAHAKPAVLDSKRRSEFGGNAADSQPGEGFSHGPASLE
jgi:AcrR family transcriptional regulator